MASCRDRSITVVKAHMAASKLSVAADLGQVTGRDNSRRGCEGDRIPAVPAHLLAATAAGPPNSMHSAAYTSAASPSLFACSRAASASSLQSRRQVSRTVRAPCSVVMVNCRPVACIHARPRLARASAIGDASFSWAGGRPAVHRCCCASTFGTR